MADAPHPDPRLRERVLEIHRRLLEAYGEPERPRMDPVSELVCTILSQNTNDVLRDRAYEALRQRFPTWEAVRDAPVEAVEEAIRIAGLAAQKARWIQGALRHITRHRGRIELDFLRDLSTEEALAWLTAIPGVGPKTAAIVLLFSLGMPAFPVDTHVHRLSRRLGLIPDRTSREKAHLLLGELVPPELYLPFHLNLIRHGRRICLARRPRCGACLLADLCPSARTEG